MEIEKILSQFEDSVFTVFDTETTGLDENKERVVEIGGVRFDKMGIISRFNVLINPEKPMPPEVVKINGITDEMLADKPCFKDIVSDFEYFIGNSILIAHNAKFDVAFVNAELKRCGKGVLQNEVIDTLELSRTVFPGLQKYALQFLAKYFDINVQNAHRAEDDARVCMELFLKCVEKMKNDSLPNASSSAEEQDTGADEVPDENKPEGDNASENAEETSVESIVDEILEDDMENEIEDPVEEATE